VFVGFPVGNFDGRYDGSMEGLTVSRMVGVIDGLNIGDFVFRIVGIAVGIYVKCMLGIDDGATLEGLNDGEVVGSHD